MSSRATSSVREGGQILAEDLLAPRLADMLRHTMIYGLSPILGRAASFLLLPLYTRLLSPADYGTLEIVLLAASLLNVFLGLDVCRSVLRLYHASEGERQRSQVISTGIVFTAVLTGAVVLALDPFCNHISIVLFGTEANAHLIRLALCSLIFTNVFMVGLASLQAQKAPGAFTTILTSNLVFALLLNLLFVAWFAWGVEGILLSQFVLTGISAVGLGSWVLGRVGLSVSLRKVREMVAYGAPLLGASLGWFVLNAADRAVLSRVGSLSEVGLYSLGDRFGAALLMFVVTPFSLFWAAEQFAVAKEAEGRDIIARVFTYFFTCLCFVALALGAWMGDVVRLVAAEQFWAAGKIGPILVLAYLLWGVFGYLTTGLLIERKTTYVGALAGGAGALYVALCVALARPFLALGVAWAKVITLGVLTVGTYLIAQHVYRVRFEVTRITKVAGISVVLFAVSRFLDAPSPLLGIVVKAPIVLGFPLALAGVGFLDAWERRWLTRQMRTLTRNLRAVVGA